MKGIEGTPQISKEEAINQIGFIKQQAAQMGFNDAEIPTLIAIEKAVNEGTTTPEKGIKDAQAILLNKQDYH